MDVALGNIWSEPETDLDRIATLDELSHTVLACQRCNLRGGCTQVVFADGVPSPLMLIGEGPGAEEDRLGRPFVGAAGQLLDKILAASGFDRQRNCYIANVVKCRPPGNRVPEPAEREACWVNLRAQIRLVRPKIVVLLGATALQALVNPQARITRSRGQWVEKDGIWFMPTYHPAALLRDVNLKRPTWEDFKAVVWKYRELVDPGHTAPHV
jgi:DNA polymerase